MGTEPKGIWLMVASSVCACTGQLLWKLGATAGPGLVVAGFVLYALGAVLMLLAYQHGELSVLQPILGLSYALSLVLGAVCLDERITPGRLGGLVLVLLGVVVLARAGTPSDRRTAEGA